jgi:hypothetical protein
MMGILSIFVPVNGAKADEKKVAYDGLPKKKIAGEHGYGDRGEAS